MSFLSNIFGEVHFRQYWLRLVWVVLGYLLLTVLFTRPLAWKTGDGYVANLEANGDGSYHFNPYHLKKCLESGSNCLHTDLQCFPVGNSLALNTNMPIPSFGAQLWANSTQGLNIILLLNCFLVAFGGFAYAKLFLRSDVLAFIAGALFAFWIGRSAHLWYGHANLMFAAPLPFALYALHRSFPNLFADSDPLKIIRIKWAGIFIALTVVTIFHDLILAGFIVIYVGLLSVAMFYRLLLHPLKWYWQALVIVGFILLVDQMSQLLQRWGFDPNGAFYFSGSLKNLFYPHPVSALYSWLFFDQDVGAQTRAGFDIGRVMFSGVAFMLFGLIVPIWRIVRKQGIAFPWMLLVLGLGLLYTMPLIRWGNGRWIYGPFSFTHFLGMWNENRCPTRFSDVLMLVGAVWALANLEQTRFWERLAEGKQIIIGMVLCCVLLFEHFPKAFFFVDVENRPSVYKALAESNEPSAMFVPFGLVDGKRSFGKMWLEPFAFQPEHGRKMHNGFLSRIDTTTYNFFANDTFTARLARNQWLLEDLENPKFVFDSTLYLPPDSMAMLASLKKLQLRQIVIKPEMESRPVYPYLLKSILPFIVNDTTFEEGHRWIRLDW